MVVYYILLLVTLGLAYPLCMKNRTRIKTVVYLSVVFGIMWFLATFRVNTGFDYNNYIRIFNEIKVLPFDQLFTATAFEPGFVLLTYLMGQLVSSSVVMYGIYSLLILLPIAVFIYKYSDTPWLAVWLYITLAFFFTNMNFIRQSLACSIGAFAYGYLLKKQPIPFIAIALLASTFHKTALILIPVYFIAHIQLTKITLSVYTGVVVVAFAFSPKIIDIITNYVFVGYKDSVFVNGRLGGRFLMIPIVALLVGAALYHSWKKWDIHAGPLLNVLILNATFWLFGAMRHMVLERFCMYSYLYTIIILPQALKTLNASPELLQKRDKLALEISKLSKPVKQKQHELEKLDADIKDHKQYYIAGVVFILFISLLYILFGIHSNNFHNVIDYHSVIPPVEQGLKWLKTNVSFLRPSWMDRQ